MRGKRGERVEVCTYYFLYHLRRASNVYGPGVDVPLSPPIGNCIICFPLLSFISPSFTLFSPLRFLSPFSLFLLSFCKYFHHDLYTLLEGTQWA